MEKITHKEIQSLKSLLDTKEKSSELLASTLMITLGIIPQELYNCMEACSNFQQTQLEVLDNNDYEVSINIGCVCDKKQLGVVNHLYKVKNLVRFEYFCDKVKIPESFSQLKNLRELKMNNSPNKGREDYLFSILSNYKDLEILAMQSNRLDFIPNSIGQFTKLRYLGLSGNDLDKLPDSISALTELEILGLVDCKFKEVPKNIFNFKKLRVLYLQNNDFEFLPDKMSVLQELEVLDISNCKMSVFPEVLFELPKLNVLKLKTHSFPDEELEKAKNHFGEKLKLDSSYYNPDEGRLNYT